ncbi:MAG: DegT/DnrJ/EryC1/StrS family aminotransferase [Candidatus Doudnabacteria bacterium]|nr:DegT/DnrJ/EryC1/StrS family aminotransferase [bacterium]MDZ4243806.1 DegT/DnrJ/EryC1/StrS family aminotransferase [Candidatus Doudnabacteria bacterium]
MRVPFVDLTVVIDQIKDAYLEAVTRLLDKKHFILTEEVEAFERAWAQKCEARYCVGVSCGADALYLALLATGIKPGDEVITQGNAYNATVTAILQTGAVPRFADIDEDTLTLDVSKAEALVNEKTKAILPVHLFGQANDMAGISDLAKRHELAIVGDCAQAHLAEFDGKPVGALGNVGAFSFYPTKNLGAFGDAGAVTTDSEKIYREILARRNLGQVAKNDHQYFGFNMRLDPVQAIALNLKLQYLEENTMARKDAGAYYDKLIDQADLPLRPVQKVKGANHVYHLYVAQSLQMDRDDLIKSLLELGVETAVHYPVPVYKQPFYDGPKDPCPVMDEVSGRIISLPLFVGITREQQEYVIESLNKTLN